MLGYLSVLNLCGLYSYCHSFWVHVCVIPIVSFPPNFHFKSSFKLFSFIFSPGLSAPHYVLPLLAPDSFQQVLKGNCNSFTLKNMCNYITERKGWSWKRRSSCSCREPKFYPPPKHTHVHLVTHNYLLPSFRECQEVCMWCTYVNASKRFIHIM